MSRDAILQQIAAAAGEPRLSHSGVTLVAVSKQQPIERITEMLDAGQRVFGENRVQEAASRWPDLRQKYAGVELHLIGHLQSNKAADAVALFDVIETLDSDKLARALAAEMQKQDRWPEVYIQVNTGEEAQKDGIAPRDLTGLLATARELGLKVSGLMCIPPQDDLPEMHFALLHKLAARHNLPHLSMGMSGDFETAIRLGATHVRIGSALFGARPQAA